jgi:hypothetical protein
VTCLDKDISKLEIALHRWSHSPLLGDAAKRIEAVQIDLMTEHWPFGPSTVSGIINIHFFYLPLFQFFERSLCTGGCLLFESVPGCGGNYVQLPKTSEIRSALEPSFDIEYYRERRVGPPDYAAVTCQVFARKRNS